MPRKVSLKQVRSAKYNGRLMEARFGKETKKNYVYKGDMNLDLKRYIRAQKVSTQLIMGILINSSHVFSSVRRDLNFIDHTSDLGMREGQRIRLIVVDTGL
ncbi:hypothetical protein POM88_018220 [Heracleum sosnowskyi]|uniref:Uncharacterized protein n=1 Tax=Heracleum sosnowskyi TaxID=360622 RepID=A0AAD8ITA3_9APIA|nr:hypothetical protein POM88_018220 [Heracleum sosnowskyi]